MINSFLSLVLWANKKAYQSCPKSTQSYTVESISLNLQFYYLNNNKSLPSDHNLTESDLSRPEKKRKVWGVEKEGEEKEKEISFCAQAYWKKIENNIENYDACNKYYLDKHSLLWKICDFANWTHWNKLKFDCYKIHKALASAVYVK